MRIRAALTELVPAINAFKLESVQLRLVDGFVLPALLAEEVLMQIEASLEFFIGLAAKLAGGDQQKDLNSLQLWLDALKAQTAILSVLTARIDPKTDRKSDELELRVERQMAEIKAGDASPNCKKLALESLQKFLDILRSMNPQI